MVLGGASRDRLAVAADDRAGGSDTVLLGMPAFGWQAGAASIGSSASTSRSPSEEKPQVTGNRQQRPPTLPRYPKVGVPVSWHDGRVLATGQSTLRPAYPVRTGRLLLRPLTVGDVDALLAYRGRPDVCRYVPFEPMTREVIAERLASQWANAELTDEGQALTLGVEVADSGELIGDVVLFWHSRAHGGGEIGYVLHPDFGGRGYATEAVRALLRLGFDELGLHRIVARLDERNESSASLARRLGMRQEARLVHNELFKGEWSTELDFAMLADEWPRHRGE
jgi:RimJ/RimL family protein N-acetyltransferase